jgi:hypothetical protein
LSAIARVATAPASARIAVASTAGRALSVASSPLGVAIEREFRSSGQDADLLTAFAALPSSRDREPPGAPDQLRALIVLSPEC